VGSTECYIRVYIKFIRVAFFCLPGARYCTVVCGITSFTAAPPGKKWHRVRQMWNPRVDHFTRIYTYHQKYLLLVPSSAW
jgi:hypothetical protein